VKFSDKGGHVDIDAQAIDGDLELSVTDKGAGILGWSTVGRQIETTGKTDKCGRANA